MTSREGDALRAVRVTGYARCDGPDDMCPQERVLRDAGCTVVIRDISDGFPNRGDGLPRALNRLGKDDFLVVASAGRLTLECYQFMCIVREVLKRGAVLRILDHGVTSENASGRSMIGHLAIGNAYEFELQVPPERVSAGHDWTQNHWLPSREAAMVPPAPGYDPKELRARISLMNERSHRLAELCAAGRVDDDILAHGRAYAAEEIARLNKLLISLPPEPSSRVRGVQEPLF